MKNGTATCACDHLTVFSGGFFASPNRISVIPSLELLASISQNPVCLGLIVTVWLIYLWVLMWAIRKDREDKIQVHVFKRKQLIKN